MLVFIGNVLNKIDSLVCLIDSLCYPTRQGWFAPRNLSGVLIWTHINVFRTTQYSTNLIFCIRRHRVVVTTLFLHPRRKWVRPENVHVENVLSTSCRVGLYDFVYRSAITISSRQVVARRRKCFLIYSCI